MTVVRSRRAGISAEEASERPLYAKVLGLQYLRPSSLMSFVFFEGSIALAVLLALAELAQWWIVVVLPLSIAAMVKLNDVIAGAAVASGSRPGRVPRARARGRAGVPRSLRTRPSAPARRDTPPAAPPPQAPAAAAHADDPSSGWADITTAVLPRGATTSRPDTTPPASRVPPPAHRPLVPPPPPDPPASPIEPSSGGGFGSSPGRSIEPDASGDWPTAALPNLSKAPTEPLPPIGLPESSPGRAASSEEAPPPMGWAPSSAGEGSSSRPSAAAAGEPVWRGGAASARGAGWPGGAAAGGEAGSQAGGAVWPSGVDPAEGPVWRGGAATGGEAGSQAGGAAWPSSGGPAGELVWRGVADGAGEVDSRAEDSAGEARWSSDAGRAEDPADEVGSRAEASAEGPSSGLAATGGSRGPSNVESVRPISPGVGLSSPEQRARQSAARRYQ